MDKPGTLLYSTLIVANKTCKHMHVDFYLPILAVSQTSCSNFIYQDCLYIIIGQ